MNSCEGRYIRSVPAKRRFTQQRNRVNKKYPIKRQKKRVCLHFCSIIRRIRTFTTHTVVCVFMASARLFLVLTGERHGSFRLQFTLYTVLARVHYTLWLDCKLNFHDAHGVGVSTARLPAGDNDDKVTCFNELACFTDVKCKLDTSIDVIGPRRYDLLLWIVNKLMVT